MFLIESGIPSRYRIVGATKTSQTDERRNDEQIYSRWNMEVGTICPCRRPLGVRGKVKWWHPL